MIEYLINDDYVNENDRIAIGVSGGADSMLLLNALIEKSKIKNFFIEVINVNHHLRGNESDNDSNFVANYCKNNGICYKIIDVDVKKLKNNQKKTLEESARILRYDAIFQEMKKEKLNKLFLAHHANDQAETILMHIFRGCGISGAVGIKKHNDNIFRPLLDINKNEILNLCFKENIPFVTDSSNLDNNYTRNYIRNIVIPSIEKVYPEVVKNICNFGEKCDEVQKNIEENINYNLIIEQQKSILIKGKAFENKNFIIREYLKIAFQKLKIFSDIEAKHFKLIEELNEMPVNSMLNMPHGVVAKKVYSGIKFYKKSVKNIIKNEYAFIEGKTEIENIGTILVEIVSENEVCYGDGSLYVDYYKISNNAVWRFRKQGDIFSKLGSGSKKLNDYFIDKKIEYDNRDYIPVLANKNVIYVVAGYDISEIVKLAKETEKIAKITLIKK